MNYTHYDLGGLGKGRTVEVLLTGNAANVYLMDHENMVKYSRGQPFQALGGLMTFSPIRLQTIASAHWHIVVDLPKGYGTVKTSHRILNSQPPNISTRLATFKPTEAQKTAIAAPDAVLGGTLPAQAAAIQPTAPSIPSPIPAPPKPSEQVSCKSCGILTIRGKFCTECGAPMEKVCPSCSAVNTLTCKFCFECGFKL
ncbi:MAG: DUF1883 domain-containing protein [Defluviitaleaceae bacterium]|nr:DUF1883 domain-containing protein [Defluviitaleaceae bacterium]